MNKWETDDWLATVRYHLKRGPVIVSKRVLRQATDATDTRNACRALTRTMPPKVVQFVPLEDGARVILV